MPLSLFGAFKGSWVQFLAENQLQKFEKTDSHFLNMNKNVKLQICKTNEKFIVKVNFIHKLLLPLNNYSFFCKSPFTFNVAVVENSSEKKKITQSKNNLLQEIKNITGSKNQL
jgi:hypothetical protein